MPSDEARDPVGPAVARLRVLVLLLCGGLALALIAAAFLAPLGGPDLERASRTFVAVAYGMAVAHGVGIVLMRRSILSRVAVIDVAADPGSRAAVLQAYQVLVVVRAALIEGASLLAVVFYALTSAWVLAAIPLAGIVLLLADPPGARGFDAFVAAARSRR